MKTLSVDEQVAVLRPSIGFAAHLHHWFLGGAAAGAIVAVVLWHPVPLMIAAFLALVGLGERRAGPNIVAAILAYDTGTPSEGEATITITKGDMDDHYHALVRRQGQAGWTYQFMPQGWRPVAGTYPARVWCEGTSNRPVLAAVDEGLLLPRGEPKPDPVRKRR